MSEEQKQNIQDQIKTWAFPILLTIVGFYLSQLVGEMREMKLSITNIEAKTTELKKDVEYLRRDTNTLQNTVEDIRRNP